MQVSSNVFAHPPPAVRPPPQVANSIESNMSNSSSSNSLYSYGGAQANETMPGPSFATSVVVSNKGSKYEISGPVNFQHVSGDVTRDRTRNAFDLNAGTNDNVLKKYMMERGITEEDIRGMKRQDVIKKIVHSNFTWMPTKQDLQAKPAIQERPLLYATISTNNQITPPHSPPPATKPTFSNYASLTSRFVDISDMDMETPGSAQPPSNRQEVGSVVSVRVQQQPQQIQNPKVPPPPSAVRANNTYGYPAAIDPRHVRSSAAVAPPVKATNETFATIAPQRKAGTMRVAPPAPPKPTILPNSNPIMASSVQYATKPPTPAPLLVKPTLTPTPAPIRVKPNPSIGAIPPPPPPMQNANASRGQVPIPPPPPPPAPAALSGMAPPPPPPPPNVGSAQIPIQKSEPTKATPVAASTGDNRDAFLESIRKGVTLKKVDQKAATISGIKPRAERKPPTTDFLSELKLGITLRRVKNPADNPYSEANTDESQA
ncbi:uncharacterized protein Dwil_GK11123, isoform B [Drosophila willistoni]|nr:formin-like protein 20 isoform X2 [Drosophila willistoni]KRF99418.1 uncharacterized protein Dwil_GK11123, isoform B [Drosophila willistoni]